MKFKAIISAVVIATIWLRPSALSAQIFFDLDMTDPGNWNVNASPLAPSTPFDYEANWGVSYTSTLGVPQDPYSISTTALQLKINETSGEQAGVSVSPVSLELSTNFVMTFDMWLNYNRIMTNDSTQVGSYGISSNSTTATWAGVGGGQLFGEITDNGSTVDYRGYNNGFTIGSGPFVAGSQNETTVYYTNLFPSVAVPSGETALDPLQYGSSYAGTVSFQWVKVNVSYYNGTLSESINGHLIASYTNFSIGSDIFLGMYDVNNSSTGTNGLADQNYVLFDNVQVESVQAVPYTFSGITGTTNGGAADGEYTNAAFNGPHSTTVDANDNVYVADTENSTIRKVAFDGTYWAASTIAGMATNTGSADGTNTSARYNHPGGVAVDRAGNVYVADTGNNIIRKLSLSGSNWITLTISGNVNTNGTLNGTNLTARFKNPEGIAVGPSGNLYVADTFNHTIRMISLVGTNYITTTYAGSAGTSGTNDGTNFTAHFNYPQSLAVDGMGNVYVADTTNSDIREITLSGTNRVVTTIFGQAENAGYLEGENKNAQLSFPEGIAVDSAGDLFVADSGNNVIRMLIPAGTNWVGNTIGGTPGVAGFGNGLGTNAQFTPYPEGICVDAWGNTFSDDDYISEGVTVFGGVSLLGENYASGDQYWIIVNLGPTAAVNAGGAWTLQGNPTSSFTSAPNSAMLFQTQNAALEFRVINGWNAPSNPTIDVPAGSILYAVKTNLNYTVPTPVLSLTRANGLTLSGTIGATYAVEYTYSLTAPWKTNTIVDLTVTPQQIEPWPPGSAAATFYRAKWLGY